MTARTRTYKQTFQPYTAPQPEPGVTYQDAPTYPDVPRRIPWRDVFRAVLFLTAGVFVAVLYQSCVAQEAVPPAAPPALLSGATQVWPQCWPDDCTDGVREYSELRVGQVDATIVANEKYCVGGRAARWLEPVESTPGQVVLVIKTQCLNGSDYHPARGAP
jgi:hypothetical protein